MEPSELSLTCKELIHALCILIGEPVGLPIDCKHIEFIQVISQQWLKKGIDFVFVPSDLAQSQIFQSHFVAPSNDSLEEVVDDRADLLGLDRLRSWQLKLCQVGALVGEDIEDVGWQVVHVIIPFEPDAKLLESTSFDMAGKKVDQLVNDDWHSNEAKDFDASNRYILDFVIFEFLADSLSQVLRLPSGAFISPDSSAIDVHALRCKGLFKVLVEISERWLEQVILKRFAIDLCREDAVIFLVLALVVDGYFGLAIWYICHDREDVCLI